jgi:hypothetical protein
MINKKGVISLQLNWIFVMIIGAIILIFFITIVQKQKEYSEENIAGSIQTDLQAIFSSSHVSKGTSSIIEVPNQDINFNCEGFKIGNQFPAHYPYAFAPDLIKSDRNTISVYAYDWSIPYRVTNFLYVTSPDVRYILQGDIDLITALESILPPERITQGGTSKLFMNREKNTDLSTNKNNYKVRIILIDFNGNIGNILSVNNAQNLGVKYKDLSAVFIQPSCDGTEEQKLDCYGDLEFYNYDGASWTFTETYQYLGKASLLAAIFSENAEIYECGMKNAFERLEKVTEVYINRTDELESLGLCSSLYGDTLDDLSSVYGQSTLEEPSYFDINSASQSLETTNDLLLSNSCSAIY